MNFWGPCLGLRGWLEERRARALGGRLLPGRQLGVGRFLIRPSDSLFLAPQSDLEKKEKTPFDRAWRETPKSGVFLVHRRRRKIFLATQELQSGQFGLRMAKKRRT
jgi:hypothetical protein